MMAILYCPSVAGSAVSTACCAVGGTRIGETVSNRSVGMEGAGAGTLLLKNETAGCAQDGSFGDIRIFFKSETVAATDDASADDFRP